MQIYLFTIKTSTKIKDNIDLQIYADNYHVAYEILVLTNDIDECDVTYDGKIISGFPLEWIGTA